ncbi:MAG TPA: two-component system response regulator, partial [Planctomycetes bacterium]|nr:two-component system response regulator [Planctomycetota bacterium]
MPRKPERVLVVDDEDNLRRVLSREIAAMGYAVGEARDADAALVALEGDE